MGSLITSPIHKGETPKLTLGELSGKEFPEIETPILYSWRVDLEGSRTFAHVKELKVFFKFSDTEKVSIKEITPEREREEKANLTLSLIPNFVSVSFPLNDKQVTGIKTPEGGDWTFFDIALPDKPILSLWGYLVVEFQRAAEGKRVSVRMQIEPDFYYKRRILKSERPQHKPVIEYLDVSANTKTIRPYDPKIGKPTLDNPDEERIREYDWKGAEGILKKKPGIRNVALRTETFSLLLSRLQEKIPPEEYSEVMRRAGFKIGENFVDDMMHKDIKLTPNEWSDYDSAAGMGRYKFPKDKDEPQVIEVKNSFIAYDRHSEKPVCDFFCGYFEGGLGKIYGKRFIVTEEKCIAQEGVHSCVFKMREAKNTQA